MQHGGPSSPSLRASLAAPSDAAELDETPSVVSALPPSGLAGPEVPPQPEPKLMVLPETKVLAGVDFKHPARTDIAKVAKPLPQSRRDIATATPPPAAQKPTPPTSKLNRTESPLAVSHKPTQAVVAGSSGSGVKPTAQVNRAHPQPTRSAASRGRGSTGTDAVTAAGSSGNRGGGQVDQAASPAASNPVPPYPADALARGVEGLVLLRVRIGADGSVEEAAVYQSSGTPSLDESALSTVRNLWRFQPATRCGVAVAYEAIQPIRFTIRAS